MEVTTAFVNYFNNLFAAILVRETLSCIQTLDCRVSGEMNSSLLKPFVAEEVCEAIHQMAPTKAPGPDGFSTGFFQKNWVIMGEEITRAVLNILNSGFMPSRLNETHITLTPKVKCPSSVTEFRPISLCNVLYNVISKILANRLKKILPLIISPFQSVFFSGQLIIDNVLVAYESLHTMHTRLRGHQGFIVIKLDMSKAYDRVDWGFLKAVMRKMGV